MPLDQPTFPGERLLALTGAGRILTSAFATNPAAALDDDPATFASFGEEIVTPGPGQALDVVYLIDRSGSMVDAFGSGTRMKAATDAILAASQILADADNGSRVAIVSFGAGGIAFGNEDTQVEAALTDVTGDFPYLTAVLESLQPVGSTPTREGLLSARALLEARGDASRPVVLFLLSDGIADDVSGAKNAAAALKVAHPGWKLVAVAVDFDDDSAFMSYIGTTVGDGFLNASSPAALSSALTNALQNLQT